MPIRTTLALWYGLLTLVILTLVAGVRYAGQQQLLHNQQDYGLKVVADVLDSSMPRRTPSKEVAQKAVARIVADYRDIELKGTIIKVYDPLRGLVFSSSRAEEEWLPLTDQAWDAALKQRASLVTMTLSADQPSVRVLTKLVFNRETLVYVIQVGRSLYDIEASLGNFVLLSLIFIPASALLVGISGWWLSRRALQPLGDVIETAHRISTGELSHRIDAAHYSEEIRELAQAFNQMMARLEASFQQIRDFSDNVSHELRIPLSILQGQTELSLRRSRSEADYRKVLESNLEEIQRMEKIVERLLFLSRADRGEITLNLAEVDLHGLLGSVAGQFKVPAEEKQLCVSLRSDGPLSVVGDEVLLRELVLNLVQNAITYTPPGGEVTLSLGRQNGRIALTVADTGCGIPREEIHNIFERFYKVDRSRAGQGSGLGLSLCRWIAEAHQGRIMVNSTVGTGSRFTVLLPAPH